MTNRQSVRIEFEKSKEYKRTFATGVWGGLTPMNTLDIEFFEDIPPLPNHTNLIIDQHGIASESIDDNIEGIVTRYIQSGITIPCDLIPSMIAWLQSKHAEYLKIQSDFKGQNNTH